MSALTFLDQLLEILDQLHWNTFDKEDMPRLELLPPLLDLIKHHTTLTWWERVVMILTAKPIQALQNSFLDTFPPPLVYNPTISPKTCAIPGSLSQHQTALLVKNCKTNNCTVTGALAVCLATALFEIAEECGKNLEGIPLSFPVNTRKDCKPVVNDEDFGLFIGIIILSIDKSDSNFWDQVRKVTSEIKQQVNDKKQFGVATCMENGVFNSVQIYEDSKNNSKYAGRYPVFELTNCGKFSMVKNRVYKVREFHFGVAENEIGPMFTVSVVTVNGQLNWTLIYGNIAFHEKNASRFSELFNESIIKLVCYL
jgi:hypothetical protein